MLYFLVFGSIFKPGSNGIEFQHTVKPQAEETVVALFNTNLKAILDTNEVTELVVIGAISHI